MEIVYYGHSCFRIRTKKAVIVTDPYDDSTGFSLPKLSADIVTVSHQHADHNNIGAVEGTPAHPDPFVIQGPGEYEVSQAYIWGLQTYHDADKGKQRGKNTVYFILAEGLWMCHLGDLGHPLSDKMVEKISQTDILFLPVGGEYTLGAAQAMEVVEKINPNIVIPMHYQLPGSKIALASVNEFLNKAGLDEVKPIAKLSVKTDTLPEEREIIVLEKK